MKFTSNTTFAFCLFILFSLNLSAATFTSAKSGNWNSSNTWVESGFPSSSDDIIILSGHIVTKNGSAYTHTGNITVLEGGELIAKTGNSSSGFTLMVVYFTFLVNFPYRFPTRISQFPEIVCFGGTRLRRFL